MKERCWERYWETCVRTIFVLFWQTMTSNLPCDWTGRLPVPTACMSPFSIRSKSHLGRACWSCRTAPLDTVFLGRFLMVVVGGRLGGVPHKVSQISWSPYNLRTTSEGFPYTFGFRVIFVWLRMSKQTYPRTYIQFQQGPKFRAEYFQEKQTQN